MSNLPFAIPDVVRRNVLGWFGAAGAAWLEALPASALRLAAHWELTLGPAYDGGSHALVLRAVRADGTPAVLKIPYVEDENRYEADILRHYGGNGAVRLYDVEPTSGGLLLERLEPGTPLLQHPDRAAALDIACGIMRRLWHPIAPGHKFRLVRDEARAWVDELPRRNERLGRPVAVRLVEEAVALALEFSAFDGDEVVVNRDIHLDNILAAGREPWLLIDPKPLVGEPAFDTGFFLLAQFWDDPHAADVRRLIARLAKNLDLEPRRIRGWAMLRAVDNVLNKTEDGNETDTAIYLAQAESIAAVRL